MQYEDNIYDATEETPPFNLRGWFREVLSGIKEAVRGKFIFLSSLFLPWYVWSITFYPEPLLWWLATGASMLLLTMTILHPRSVLYWIAPCFLLFNTLYFWLPWPGIKMSYIAPAAVCFGVLVNFVIKGKKNNHEQFISFEFKIFLACLISAGFIGILSFFDWNESASWYELAQQLRRIPILSEKEKYVTLRYLWVWLLAVSAYGILRRLVRNLKDIHKIFWSLQFTSIIITAFGLFSYITRQYMVAHYVFERRINATLSSPAVLADIFMAIFVIGIYLLKVSKSLTARVFLVVTLTAQLTVIFLSGCRTNFILITVYLLILGILYGRKFIKKTKWYIKVSAIIFFVIIVFVGLNIAGPKAQTKISKLPVIKRIIEWKKEYKYKKTLKKTLLKGRFNHWIAAENMINQNPMWGVGCGLFEQKYKSYHDAKDFFWYARAHCVPLRICAEGGFVTFIAFSAFLILGVIRLSYGFTRRAMSKEPEWSKLTRTMAVVFLMIFISSFFTDIFYENSESIMFLSILAVCGACGYKHTGRLLRQHFIFFKRKINNIENELNMFFIGIGWEYLGFISIKSILKVIIISSLLFIIFLGVSNASIKRQKLFSNGKLDYGFLNKYKKHWYIIGRHAMTGFVATDSVFSFSYKAFNIKMAQLDQYLELYINDVLIKKLPLDSVSEQIIYCDISEFSGSKVKINFKVNHIFIPIKEKWFIDPRKYGALITKPEQICDDLETIHKDVQNSKKIKWISE
ncbi:O-antigen ligase family protein [bacterium]|nr:O-antigen ligase family protein [bacterium]